MTSKIKHNLFDDYFREHYNRMVESGKVSPTISSQRPVLNGKARAVPQKGLRIGAHVDVYV